MSLLGTGRPREGMVLLRGAHQLALAHDLRDRELEGRLLPDLLRGVGRARRGPRARPRGARDRPAPRLPCLRVLHGRERLRLRAAHRRLGLGRGAPGGVAGPEPAAIGRTEFHADHAILRSLRGEEATEGTGGRRSRSGSRATTDPEFESRGLWTAPWAEFHVDRAILRSLRGEDASVDLAAAARIRLESGVTAPQYEAYELWAGAWAAFAGGRPDEVRRLGERAVENHSNFNPLVCPLLVRSALWAGDAAGAASALAAMEASGSLGPALAADRLLARAGIDALEGRGPAALAGYREALRAYRRLGLAFDRGGGRRGHGRPPAVPGAGRRRRRDGVRGRPRHARAPRCAPVPRPARRRSHEAANRVSDPLPPGADGPSLGDPGPDASSGQGLTNNAPYGHDP